MPGRPRTETGRLIPEFRGFRWGFKRLKHLKTLVYLVAGDLDLPAKDDLLHVPTQS